MENKKTISEIAKISDRSKQEPKERKLKILEFKNQRIMTTKVLAEQFGTNEQNVSKNFTRNQSRFKEGKHYFKLEGQELKDFKGYVLNDESLKYVSVLYLWTDRGAARHAKILDTDEAWEVYEELEENYFNPRRKKLSPMDQLRLQYQVLENHEVEIKEVKGEIKDLKDNMPLFNIDCYELQKEVKKIGIKSLGGKDSLAYKDKSIRTKVYSDIQQQVKRQFDVKSYKAIKRCQLEIAKEIINNYKLPFVLEREIEVINNQVSIQEVACSKEEY